MLTTDNRLHYYCDLLKNKSREETGAALHNIIRTMKVSRHGKVCGEDFSHLDFGSIPLTDIEFSMNGTMPSSFNNCIISKWNFRSAGHYDNIIHAEFSDDSQFLITWGKDARVIVWRISDFTPCIDCEFDYEYMLHGVNPELDNTLVSPEFPKSIKDYINNHLTERCIINSLEEEQKETIVQHFENLIHSSISNRIENNRRIISYTSNYVMIEYEDGLYLMDILEYRTVKCIMNGPYKFASIAPNDRYFLVANDRYYVFIYSLPDMRLIKVLKPIRSLIKNITLSANLKYCVSFSYEPDCIKPEGYYFWDIDSERLTVFPDSVTTVWKSDLDYVDVLRWYDDEYDTHTMRTYHSPNKRFDVSIYDSDWGFSSRFSLTNTLNNEKKHFETPLHLPILGGAITSDSRFFVCVTDSHLVNDIVFSPKIIYYDILNDSLSVVNLVLPKCRYITNCTLSLYGDYLFSVLNDGKIYVIESNTGRVIKELIHTSSVHVKNCNFVNVTTDSESYRLLYQYGAKIDEDRYPKIKQLDEKDIVFSKRKEESREGNFFLRGDGLFTGTQLLSASVMPNDYLRAEMEKYGLKK